jgi:hypothetical protein
MKTKKIILFTSALFLSTTSTLFAQGFYATIGGGYNFPVAGTPIQDETIKSTSNTSMVSFTGKTLSYGKGVDFGASVGYMFTKNVGIEIGASYLDGTNTTATDMDAGTTNYSKEAYNGTMLRFIPACRIQSGEGLVRPYGVLGAIIGTATNANITETYGPSNSIDGTVIYNGGYSFGFHAAVGATITCVENISVFIELAVNYQNYAPATAVATGNAYYLGQGVQTVSYGNSGSYYPSVNNTSSTLVLPQIYLPFSSLGINAGFHFSFAKSAKAATAIPAVAPAAVPAK